jgi:hypothetical protein
MPKPKETDPSRLTDEECDFIIQRILWKLRDAVSPQDFFREMGRGVAFDVAPENRANVRNMVRWFARGDG